MGESIFTVAASKLNDSSALRWPQRGICLTWMSGANSFTDILCNFLPPW